MANIGRIGKIFKPSSRPTPKGAAGYDNARENIDPHIKTKVVSTQEGSIERTPTQDKHIANKKYVDDNIGGGDVSAAANLTDIKIVQGDGGAKGVKTSNATVTQVMNSAVHTAGDGSDHADVATNTTHRGLTNNPHTTTAAHVGLGNVSNVATNDTAYNATSWDNNLDAATKNAIRDKFESLAAGHDAVTLNANATAAGLSLSTQELNYRAATNAQTGYMTAAFATSIEANVSHVADVTGDPHNIAADTLAFTNKTLDANATGNALSNIDIANCIAASQAEAEAGTENTKILTPLRTKQAIVALGGGGGSMVLMDYQEGDDTSVAETETFTKTFSADDFDVDDMIYIVLVGDSAGVKTGTGKIRIYDGTNTYTSLSIPASEQSAVIGSIVSKWNITTNPRARTNSELADISATALRVNTFSAIVSDTATMINNWIASAFTLSLRTDNADGVTISYRWYVYKLKKT